MNHIVIIGFMGSGKTRVGKRLAKDLGLPFIAVDRLCLLYTSPSPRAS